jgi:CBS-domain-containing membrane protein
MVSIREIQEVPMRLSVKDVMTTDVVVAAQDTPFHAVADLLIEHGVSGVPVVDEGRVVGVVSETDLLYKEEFKQRYYGDDYRPPLRARLRHRLGEGGHAVEKAQGEIAAELMTSPAIVTTPDSAIVLAVRLMDRHGVKRLPVVDGDGRLVGIISRRDLLKAFVRDDVEIRSRVRQEIQAAGAIRDIDTVGVTVAVTDGVVTLSGKLRKREDVITIAYLAENVDGVVAVVDELTWTDEEAVPLPVWGGF